MSRNEGGVFARAVTVPLTEAEWAEGARNGRDNYLAWSRRNPPGNRSRGPAADEAGFIKGTLAEVAATASVNPWRHIITRYRDRTATLGRKGDIVVDGVAYEVKGQYADLMRPKGRMNVNCRAHQSNPGRYVFAIIDPKMRTAVVTREVPAAEVSTWPEVDYGYGDPCLTLPVAELLERYGR